MKLLETLKKIIDPKKFGGRSVPRRIWVWHRIINIVIPLLWCTVLGISTLYLARVTYDRGMFFSYFDNFLIIILNILPVFWLFSFFFSVFNRMWAAFLASGFLTVLLTLINYFKILFRNDPLFASDIYVIKESASAGAKFSFAFSKSILGIILIFIAGVVFAAFFLKARIPGRKIRIISPLCLLIMGGILLTQVYQSPALYAKTANFDIDISQKISKWSFKDKYTTRGFLYPLLHSTGDLSSGKPEGYDKAAVEEDIASFGGTSMENKVDIISIMLESFADFSKFDIDFVEDPAPFFTRLKEEAYSGQLLVNSFAGGTVKTERAFLTGHIYDKDLRAPSHSYVRYLKANGYYTEFAHPCYKWFYNRQNVMDYLGFDELYFYENRYSEGVAAQTIMADDRFIPDIITLYEQAKLKEMPYFGFNLTYQNHGPYAKGSLQSDRVFVEKSGKLSDEGFNIFNNYLYGLSQTDKALEALFAYFEGCTRPVVILIFGDHMPWLGDGSFVYNQLGIPFSGDEGLYNQYSTPYVIWGNPAAKQALNADFAGRGPTVSPNFLMSVLFDEMGIGGDSFMALSRQLRDRVPVIQTGSSSFIENGVIKSQIEDEKGQELYNLHLYYEYYRQNHDPARK